MRPSWSACAIHDRTATRNRAAAGFDFIAFAGLPSACREDNSRGTGTVMVAAGWVPGMGSRPGSSLCQISSFLKKIDTDMKIIDTLRYHSPRI
jgi:hypothetical protein